MFFELHSGGERAVLVQISLDGGMGDPDLGEFIELVRSAGGDPVTVIRGSRKMPQAKYFIGKGKLYEVKAAVEHAPVKAQHSEEQNERQGPGLMNLGGKDGEQHQRTADQPGAIAAIVDEQSGQSQQASTDTLAQGCSR